MGYKTSAESSTKESCQLSDGVVWKAYRFDGQGNYFTKKWDLIEDIGKYFCWYHGELPNRNQKLSSFEGIFIEKLCPPLKPEDITRMVNGGPFCDHIDGALFLRVNSSGPSLSNFGLRLAARITENSVITMSLGPNLTSGFPREIPNLVRHVDEIRLEMNEEEADNPPVETVGSLLIHFVKRHVDYLQKIVTELEIDLDTIEEESAEIGGGTVKLEMWGDGRLAKLHLDLQRLLRVIAHVEQVFPRIEENFSQKSWWILPDNVYDLRAAIDRLGRLKENVGLIGSRVAAIQEDFDSRQARQINQKLYYLSILSVFLLPLSFITGIFGLSVGGIPWKDDKDGFWNVLLIGAVITVVLACCMFPVLYRHIKKRALALRILRKIFWKRHYDAR